MRREKGYPFWNKRRDGAVVEPWCCALTHCAAAATTPCLTRAQTRAQAQARGPCHVQVQSLAHGSRAGF